MTTLSFHHRPLISDYFYRSDYSYRLPGHLNMQQNAHITHDDPAEHKHLGRHGLESLVELLCVVCCVSLACIHLVFCFVFLAVMQKNLSWANNKTTP